MDTNRGGFGYREQGSISSKPAGCLKKYIIIRTWRKLILKLNLPPKIFIIFNYTNFDRRITRKIFFDNFTII